MESGSQQAASIPGERAWLVWVIFFAAVVLIASRPWRASEAPAASALAEGDFSAARAWTHLDTLAGKLGRRVSGTETCVRAADYIEGRLRGLGVETERQVADGSVKLEGTTYAYRGVQNVLARIRGHGAPAILVSAHYDSGAEGPGAGDNALNVAAALEIVRAILVSGVPQNTIVFNFNGGEELGLLGAAAFVHHPWFRDVAAFINLDASGPSGRQLLLQVGPGGNDLLETYATSARYLHGTVLAQEIFQILPLDTDYHLYREVGLPGLDLAPYGDSYAYHTALDGPERVSRRTLQESGENVLALLRGLHPLSSPPHQDVLAPATYYDLLGLAMVRYSARTAQFSGLLVGALGLSLVYRRRAGARLALGTASVGVSALCGLAAPILASFLVTFAGQAMFWFSRPWLALGVYGALAALGVFGGHSVMRRLALRRGVAAEVVTEAVRRGLVVMWALLLLLTTALGLGSAYLPLWWCAGSALTFIAWRRLSGAGRWLVTLAGVAMAAVTTVQASDLVLTAMIPLTGLLGADVPADLLVASISALSVAPFALLMAPALPPARSPRRIGGFLAAAMVVIAGLVTYSFPYTPERPKRAYVDVRANGNGEAHVVVETIDSGPDLAVKHAALGAAITRPMPAIEVLSAGPTESSGPHTVRIRLKAEGAYLVEVQLNGAAKSWSIGAEEDSARHFVWVGTRHPLTFSIKKMSEKAVNLRVKAYYLGSDVPVDHVLERLPRWAAPTVGTVIETDLGI